jgi:uncharacterized membrane protein
MSPSETLSPAVIALVLVMAGTSYVFRAGGFWLMAHVPMTPRLRRMIDALPGSIVAATALPVALHNGPAAVLAVVASAGSMALWRNDFLAVVIGIAVAAGARAAGFT